MFLHVTGVCHLGGYKLEVEFNDGSILGHLGVTDMKLPILFALAWPERVQSPVERLNLATMPGLTFAAPDLSKFPCLAHALSAAEMGGTAPAVLNAANEVAVAAFCDRRIGFLQIEVVVGHALATCPVNQDIDLESVEAADAAARRLAREFVERVRRNEH